MHDHLEISVYLLLYLYNIVINRLSSKNAFGSQGNPKRNDTNPPDVDGPSTYLLTMYIQEIDRQKHKCCPPPSLHIYSQRMLIRNRADESMDRINVTAANVENSI